MSRITPFLWFNDNLEEAINFYTTIFKSSTVDMHRAPDGKAITAKFELEGQKFMGLNGGPMFTFNEAMSLFVSCNDQDEVDFYWNRLLEGGGKECPCGWLKDRFGVYWQVIPDALGQYLGSPDPEKSGKAMAAMQKMTKIVVKDLEEACR